MLQLKMWIHHSSHNTHHFQKMQNLWTKDAVCGPFFFFLADLVTEPKEFFFFFHYIIFIFSHSGLVTMAILKSWWATAAMMSIFPQTPSLWSRNSPYTSLGHDAPEYPTTEQHCVYSCIYTILSLQYLPYISQLYLGNHGFYLKFCLHCCKLLVSDTCNNLLSTNTMSNTTV